VDSQWKKVMDDEQRQNDRIYDFFKHFTTLNTAAILLALTLLEKFVEPTDTFRLNDMFCSFGASLLASITMLVSYTFFWGSGFGQKMGYFSGLISLIAIILFLRGVWQLVVVVIQGVPGVVN
jgi:hypothetical protein